MCTMVSSGIHVSPVKLIIIGIVVSACMYFHLKDDISEQLNGTLGTKQEKDFYLSFSS